MYNGYAKGVLGWNKKEEVPSEEYEAQMASFVGFIHHWAAHFELTAFVDDKGDAIQISIRESGKIQHIHKSDIYAGNCDPRKIVVGLSGRTDLE